MQLWILFFSVDKVLTNLKLHLSYYKLLCISAFPWKRKVSLSCSRSPALPLQKHQVVLIFYLLVSAYTPGLNISVRSLKLFCTIISLCSQVRAQVSSLYLSTYITSQVFYMLTRSHQQSKYQQIQSLSSSSLIYEVVGDASMLVCSLDLRVWVWSPCLYSVSVLSCLSCLFSRAATVVCQLRPRITACYYYRQFCKATPLLQLHITCLDKHHFFLQNTKTQYRI